MKNLRIRGEYWFTSDNSLLHAHESGDYNHEGHVMEHIISMFCDHLGIENSFETDAVFFRTAIYDSQCDQDDGKDAIDDAAETMIREGMCPEMVKDMRSLVGGSQMDAREFAINHWNWIRIAGANMECKNLLPQTLQRAHKAISAAYFEEADDGLPVNRSVNISSYHGQPYEISLPNLRRGKLERQDRQNEIVTRSARIQMRKLELAIQHPCYGNVLGG